MTVRNLPGHRFGFNSREMAKVKSAVHLESTDVQQWIMSGSTAEIACKLRILYISDLPSVFKPAGVLSGYAMSYMLLPPKHKVNVTLLANELSKELQTKIRTERASELTHNIIQLMESVTGSEEHYIVPSKRQITPTRQHHYTCIVEGNHQRLAVLPTIDDERERSKQQSFASSTQTIVELDLTGEDSNAQSASPPQHGDGKVRSFAARCGKLFKIGERK